MKKILLPIDLSSQSQPPIDYAIAWAKANKAEIYLFHSYFERLYIAAGTFPESLATQSAVDVQMISEISQDASKRLDSIAKDINRQLGAKSKTRVNVKIESGEPYSSILAYADEIEPDIIIMGAMGYGSKNHFSGSIAQKMMNKSPYPVMAIPGEHSYTNFDAVLYPADLSDSIQEDLKNLLTYFSPYKTTIYCVHMLVEGDDLESFTYEELKEEFAAEIVEEKIKFRVCHCTTVSGEFSDLCQTHNIRLIAFHQHRTSFFSWFKDELSKRDLYKANIPLLSLPCNH